MATVKTCGVRGVKVPAAGDVDRVPHAAVPAATRATPTSLPHKRRIRAIERLLRTRKSLPPKDNGQSRGTGAVAAGRAAARLSPE